MTDSPDEPVAGGIVRAAGGVVVGDDGRVAVVHRPRYDDWSLPKGKLDPGERAQDGAVRETEEETGLRCLVRHYLGREAYTDHHGRPKVVDYWLMEPVGTVAPAVGSVQSVPKAIGGLKDTVDWTTSFPRFTSPTRGTQPS